MASIVGAGDDGGLAVVVGDEASFGMFEEQDADSVRVMVLPWG